MSDPIPLPYFHFFATVEPFLTICGSAKAVFTSAAYFNELIPIAFEPPPIANAANVMVTRQLGSCFFLLALVAAVFVRTLKYQLASHPKELERCFASYLFCLAVADLTHIGFTLYDLGRKNAFDFKNWNILIWGNVGITTGLFVVRSMWFAGIGRGVIRPAKRATRTTSARKSPAKRSTVKPR